MKGRKLNYIIITKQLMNLSMEHLSSSAEIFVSDSSLAPGQKFRKFGICLQKAIIMRPDHAHIFCAYIKEIIGILPDELCNVFKECILQTLIHDFVSDELLGKYCAIANFLSIAVEFEIFAGYEIANHVHDLMLQKVLNHRIFTELYFWFFHEFSQVSATFIKSMRRHVDIEKTARTLPQRYRTLLHRIDELGASKVTRRCTDLVKEDPLMKPIKSDSLKEFKVNLLNKARINDRIKGHPFEIHWMLLDNPTVAQVCAYFGASKCLRYLIRKKVDLEREDDKGRQIRDFAVAGQNIEIMYMLNLSQGDIMSSAMLFHSKDMITGSELEFKISPEQVIFSNNIAILRKVLTQDNVDEDMLMVALVNECPRAFLHMLASFPGLDLNARSFLHVAVQTGQIDIISKLLKNSSVDVNAINESGKTPLHIAIETLRKEVIDLLLACERVNVDVNWSDNRSMLHEAILRGGLEAVKSILKCERFDVNRCDANNQTPLHYATRNVNSRGTYVLVEYRRGDRLLRDEKYIFNYPRSIHDEILMALLECRRVRLDVFDNIGWSPVHHAARYGRFDFVRLFELSRDDHDVNITTLNEHQNVLHIAALYGRNIVVFVLRNSVDLDRFAVDANGRDAVHLSAIPDDTAALKMLLAEKTVELNVPDKVPFSFIGFVLLSWPYNDNFCCNYERF